MASSIAPRALCPSRRTLSLSISVAIGRHDTPAFRAPKQPPRASDGGTPGAREVAPEVVRVGPGRGRGDTTPGLAARQLGLASPSYFSVCWQACAALRS